MPFTVNGTNLDSIFENRINSKRADVNFDNSGTDISNRYEAAGTGDLIGYNTNFQVNGVDLRVLFIRDGTYCGCDGDCGMQGGD